jgi:phage terminase Nu1 subunit (DNA packaging protein)
MQNYFEYFTEIEERFQQRRGSILMLSTLDWALIETWREAGVPLAAVLRGIDDAFDKHDAQAARAGARRVRKVNGLAWAAQPVMLAAQAFAEAAVGVDASTTAGATAQTANPPTGFESEPVVSFLRRNAERIEAARATAGIAGNRIAGRLRELADEVAVHPKPDLEQLDRTLSVLEEQLFAELLAAAPEAELVALRAQADRELSPYRSRMQAVQIKQIQRQFLQKRLLEARGLPRLSLFYMSHG